MPVCLWVRQQVLSPVSKKSTNKQMAEVAARQWYSPLFILFCKK